VKIVKACPDGTCPEGDTCCDVGGGNYGCCPYVGADCCSDLTHCCPKGYTCDLAHGECIKSFGDNLLSHAILEELRSPLDCPAGTCPTTETCCDLGNAQYGCCPYMGADCCVDHMHCCPNGYTCDITKGECIKSPLGHGEPDVHAAFANIRTLFDVCPAGTCPSAETCCSLGDGSFGCCPYVDADCCADLTHCCPKGFQCDSLSGACVGSMLSGVHLEMAELRAVVTACACPSSNTCCPDGAGGMACCPYELADCCADHQNCCPNGYNCDYSTNQCVHQLTFSRSDMKELTSP